MSPPTPAHRADPLERVVFANGRVEVGAFRCPAGRPDFRHAGQIRDRCAFVFPRTAVWIHHAGHRPVACDPGVVVLYNPRQPFTRAMIDPDGDRCEWFAVDTATAAEVVRAVDSADRDCDRAPFPYTHGPSDHGTYLKQRQLFQELDRGVADALTAEETVLTMLARVLALTFAVRTGGRAAAGITRRERDAVRHVRARLAARFRENVSLGELAADAGLSRFRLCHAFRAVTGLTMHGYRDSLRARAALDPLGAGCGDLTRLALDLGYSSHSHFSERFRKVFGLTPSQARARL
jgi:AraC family transcriptional regulator